MPVLTRHCSLDRRPWPQRALTLATRPLTRYLSEQAAHPHGLGGPLIGRLWVKETAKTNDAAVDLLAPGAGEIRLGVAMAMIGAPFFLGLLAKERGRAWI